MSVTSLLIFGLIAIPVLGVVYIALKLRKNAEYFRQRNVPYIGAGIAGIFKMVTGSSSLVQGEDDLAKYIHTVTTPVIGLSDLAGLKNYIISDPETIKLVLVKHFDHFLNRRGFATQKTNKYLRKALVFMEGDQWRGTRSKLSPTFTTGRMRRMFQIFQSSSERFEMYLKKHMDYPKSTSVDLDFSKIFSKYALDVIANCSFGVDSQSFEVPPDQLSTFESMAKKFGFIFSGKFLLKFMLTIAAPKVADFFGIDTMDHEAQNYCVNVVKDVLSKRRQSGERREDFLQLMLDAQQGLLKADEETVRVMMGDEHAGKEGLLNSKSGQDQGKITFDDDEVVANAMSFLMAGFDTTQSLMLLGAYQLALEPEIQEKLHEKIISVLATHEGKLTYDAISEMSYLDMIINETLRLHSPATRTERCCTMDFKIPDTDVVIEKGTIIMIPIRALHKDPRYYPEPEKFIPERFTAENKANRHPYTFLPFGHGPRNCIGMRFALIKVKAMFVQLVKTFKFAPCSKTEIPIKFSNNAVIKPKDALWLNVAIRE